MFNYKSNVTMKTTNNETMAATYVKYCPNVFVAKCAEDHKRGDVILVTTKYGKENEHIVHNLVEAKNGFFFYSITRADGYNCQERAKAKAEQALASAERANEQSAACVDRALSYTEHIVAGQPILTDHYSAKHHRAALAHADSAMRKAVELDRVAKEREERAKYWAVKKDLINISMPESIDYYTYELERLESEHKRLLEHPELRSHAYSLTYAKKAVNDAKKNLETAIKLWGK